ncbi:MAG: hypothetical protein U0176_04915 [Bacteroidia bacterium]
MRRELAQDDFVTSHLIIDKAISYEKFSALYDANMRYDVAIAACSDQSTCQCAIVSIEVLRRHQPVYEQLLGMSSDHNEKLPSRI